jgi:hypothetical protein
MVHFVGEEELIIMREESENLAISRVCPQLRAGGAT